jgi:hypothetical protein
MLKFCTLFNTTYLSRGLAMYHSLEEKCDTFHLYIIAFDDDCYDTLSRLRMPHATVIRLEQFENERLLGVKSGRTPAEYCWTCASSTIKYCLETYDLDHCTYVDADLLFFSNPAVLIEEMNEKSVLITEHRYTTRYDQSASSGIYCVQFMTFKNTEEGREVLNWWVDKCIEWCFDQFEDGKFGDQKYLDDWHNRFKTVHVLKHLGGGVAPWNVQQYTFEMSGKTVLGTETDTGKHFDLVFFHYHKFRYTLDNTYSLSDNVYILPRNPVKHIYRPYVEALTKAERVVQMINSERPSHELTNDIQYIKSTPGRAFVFFLRGYYKNLYKKNALTYGFLS